MAKRKLNATTRASLFSYATTKFIDAKARAVEDKAEAKFVAALIADYERDIAPFTKLLSITKGGYHVTDFAIPENVAGGIKKGETFTKPDGAVVTREDKQEFACRALDREIHTQEDELIRQFLGGNDFPSERGSWRRSEFRNFRKSITLPVALTYDGQLGLDSHFEDKKNKQVLLFKVGGRSDVNWIREKTIALLRPFYEAGHARVEAENKLWRAIGGVIYATATFEELLTIWPEAAEMEAKLFPAKPVYQMVTLNDETKKLLCQNMADRGVEAAVCA